MMGTRWKYFLLHGLFFLYAMGSVAGKQAASYEWGREPFFVFCGVMFCIFGLYAFGWQRVLRYISLTTAYAHRAVLVLWGLIFGHFVFGELVTMGKLLGIALAMFGLILFVSERRTEDG